MKVIIAGTRDVVGWGGKIDYLDAVTTAMATLAAGLSPIRPWLRVDEVVCGMASGADVAGRQWAIARGIPVREFHADWKKHGASAGPIRNGEMADYGDLLVAIWNGESRGTLDMIRQMRRVGKPTWVYVPGGVKP